MTSSTIFQGVLLAGYCAIAGATEPIGIFEDHADIGAVQHDGSAAYDAAKRAYTVSGSGENMWSTADEFHYVWKKVSGNAMLTADIAFTTEGGDPHKKAMLAMRQSLDPASAYADAALHGNGLMSLQWRETTGAATHEVQSNISDPKRVQIEKHGEHFYLSVSAGAGDPRFSGAGMRVPLTDPFYIGIGVCAHHKESLESAIFSNVALNKPESAYSYGLYRTLETITVASTDRRVAYTAAENIESPTWTPDGKSLLFLSNDALRQVPIESGVAVAADPGPRLPPDGKNVVPDVVTEDGLSNMFPHLSPDGTRMAFLSFPRSTAREYPVSPREVMLRVMLLSDKNVRTLAKFNAGGTSFNLPSWSPDSKKLAFVSYQLR